MSTKITANAAAIRKWLVKAEVSLGNHSDRLNAINIFPVADGDTGTNLYLTVRAASDVAKNTETTDIGELLTAAGREAMEQAKGNSGTLFSVFLSAFAEVLKGATRLSPPLLTAALERAQIRAWSALTDPVPGTMLSVLEAATEGARTADIAQNGDESNHALSVTLRSMIDAALEAVKNTENQLGALAQAKVVDAGGVGFLLILDALRAASLGEELDEELLDGLHGYDIGAPHLHEDMPGSDGFEVMCTINLDSLAAAILRAKLDEIGESVIMSAVTEIEGGYRWRVHVHVPDADTALTHINAAGAPANVSITALGHLQEHGAP